MNGLPPDDPRREENSAMICKHIQIEELEEEIRELQREIYSLEKTICTCQCQLCEDSRKLKLWKELGKP